MHGHGNTKTKHIVVPHKGKVWVNKPKAKSTRRFNSSETLMTTVEWGRREARSKSRVHSYFITKVFGRKETKTKINLDLCVFYEPLRKDLCGKRFSLSVWPGISNRTVCTVAVKFDIKVCHQELLQNYLSGLHILQKGVNESLYAFHRPSLSNSV